MSYWYTCCEIKLENSKPKRKWLAIKLISVAFRLAGVSMYTSQTSK
jgi:hypothetical protein